MPRYQPIAVAAMIVALAACQADRETFEQGATMETPPAVEQAPAMPIPPQPFPPQGSPTGEELPPLDPDTFTAENIRPADPPIQGRQTQPTGATTPATTPAAQPGAQPTTPANPGQ